MTRQRKIFWTLVTLGVLVAYFILFFWMKAAGVHAGAEEDPGNAALSPATDATMQVPVEAMPDQLPEIGAKTSVPEIIADRQPDSGEKFAYFAGGCFWCVEKDFEKVEGVGDVISGFMGGEEENPVYGRLAPDSRHQEAVKIPYDPAVVSYRELVDYFFRHIDPTDAGGQFCDRGFEYTTGIWVTSEAEREIAAAAKADAEAELGQTVVTPIYESAPFWPVDAYHQDFYEKNPVRYNTYRFGCGRDARVNDLWDK